MASKFFEERSDQSEIKARIVQKYFDAWSKVIMPSAERGEGKIAYIDLYAGPGRYKDGSASTPLLVLQKAIADDRMAKMLVALFNDIDKDHSSTLVEEIGKLDGVERLKYKPVVMNNDVDRDAQDYFSETKLVPSFSFIDPFGYKGLSLRIIHGVIKDWGCDCVFFFNYQRINAGLANSSVEKHLNALFGENRANELRLKLQDKKPYEREAIILEYLAVSLRGLGGKYVLPFRFKNENGSRTSHCLIFVSKHPLGYKIMKDIMARESSLIDQGVPSFTYCPADQTTPLLFSLQRPLEELAGMLLSDFAGQTLTMEEIYEFHHIDKRYIERNYKDALMKLEAEGKIVCVPSAAGRRKHTFAKHVRVQFP